MLIGADQLKGHEMSTDIASAIAMVAKSMEDIGCDYVVYRDHGIGNRLGILVEGAREAVSLRSSLRRLGAQPSSADPEVDLVLPGAAVGGQDVEIVMKAGSGKSGVSNLLWRAATSENALVARQSVREG